jgi:hypothetical protein
VGARAQGSQEGTSWSSDAGGGLAEGVEVGAVAGAAAVGEEEGEVEFQNQPIVSVRGVEVWGIGW